jgi:hypothetical protein
VFHGYLKVTPISHWRFFIRCHKVAMGHVGVADMKASQHDLLTSCETWSKEVLEERYLFYLGFTTFSTVRSFHVG